jgi:hypothetical protein
MLEELAKEGGAECRLIASWLSRNGGENGDNKNEEKENNGNKEVGTKWSIPLKFYT